jgi:non-specific protein-tyrosine kinase
MPVNLITLTQPRSAAAEAFRTLRTNLMFSAVDSEHRTFAVTSPSRDEGKSEALANLAVTLAQSEHRTLIVDADLRRPAQHTLWNLENSQGLTTMLLEDAALTKPPIQATEVKNLGVLTSGVLPANPADALASKRMDEVIALLAQEADFVLFDVPPVLAVADAAVLGRKLNGVVLVVKSGSTRRDHITKAKTQLERVQANLIGVALTNAPRQQSSY